MATSHEISKEFYLIRYIKENDLEILDEKELEAAYDGDSEFDVLVQGDENELKKTKIQLEAGIRVTVAGLYMNNESLHHQQEPLPHRSPELFKIIRTVSVTESGNTKYSEPFSADSGDSYKPKEDDVESDYTYDDDTDDDDELMKSVKKVLRFDCSKSSPNKDTPLHTKKSLHVRPVISSDISGESQSIASSSASLMVESTKSSELFSDEQTIGELIINIKKGDVAVNFFNTLHSATYDVSLSKTDDETELRGFIFAQDVAHRCCPVDPRRAVCSVTRSPDKMLASICFYYCCDRNGYASGKEVFIGDLKKHVTTLTYSCDEVLDELDVTPVKDNINKTKLKQHYCMYCDKLKTCIGRHLKTVHATEDRVKEILAADKCTSFKLMRKLRLEADRNFNDKVALSDRIPIRKPLLQMTSKSVHCPMCNALIARRNFYKHNKRCYGRVPDKRRRLVEIEQNRSIVQGTSDDAIFSKVCRDLADDDITKVVKTDPHLKLLGVYLARSQPQKHKMTNTRQQLRRMARLLMLLRRENSDIQSIADMLKPGKYRIIGDAIRRLCGETCDSQLKSPSLALQYGPLLTHIIRRAQINLLEQNVEESDPTFIELRNFEQLHSSDFKVEVTRTAIPQSRQKKHDRFVEMPEPRDVQILMQYLKKLISESYEYLKKNGYSHQHWCSLSKAVLCQLLVFNRRRPGETSEALLTEYQRKRQVEKDKYPSMNRLEIILCKRYSAFIIRAKRGRFLNVLVTQEQIKYLDLLICMRKSAGISDDNNYLFANTSKPGHFSAGVCLRKFAYACGAKKPESLRSTCLRKQVATMSQFLLLNDNEIRQLCDFMGHDERIHQMHYRLSEMSTQVTKFSRFLSIVGDNDVYLHKGKTLDELPDNEIVQENSSDDDNDSAEESQMDEEPSTSRLADDVGSIRRQYKTPMKRSKSKRVRKMLKPYSPTKTPQKDLPREQGKRISKTKTLSPGKSPTTHTLLRILNENPRNRNKLRWTDQEKDFVYQSFSSYFETNTMPLRNKINKLFENNRDKFDQSRSAHTLYCFIKNIINSKSKKNH